ncbi:hypothetical protein ACQCSU_00325 [Pseudarthrobacter sp. O4]|uniref:hypothetical protein n=1 Tax=Pseudarthrobacter sp. O4 TaxID=3418417 RepID=UPI003CEDC75A
MDLRDNLRLFRSALITGTTMSLAAAGHVLGGGTLPEPAVMAVLAGLLLTPVTWLARRQLSFLTLLGMLGSGQLMLHEAFTSLSPRAICLPSLTDQVSHHDGRAMGLDCFAAVPSSMPVHTGGADSPVLLAGHVLALVSTAWLLRKGEVALWQLVAWLCPLVKLPRPAGIIPVRQRPIAAGPVLVPLPRRNLRADSLRGPPTAASPRAMP